MNNIVDILIKNAESNPDKPAYIQVNHTGIKEVISYGDLVTRIQMLAGYLQEFDCYNERVVIMLPSGINYIISFFAALFSHAIAVPAYPVTNSYHKERLGAILSGSDAKFIITDSKMHKKMQNHFEDEWDVLSVLEIDKILEKAEDTEYIKEEYSLDEIAYIQYTSGSTRDAKGVMISYRNIQSNEKTIQDIFEFSEETVIVSWLPFYHDMGLIGNIILNAYLNSTCYFMASMDFIQTPELWLETVSKYKGTLICAPNFAYQMCVDEIEENILKNLNLSSLKVAVNGAEPVRLETLQAFYEKFEKCNLGKNVMKPSYGLAENTLLTTTYNLEEEYWYKVLDIQELNKNQIKYSNTGIFAVSAGHLLEGIDIKIIDSDTGSLLSEKKIGEIYISSDSASTGYWNCKELNDQYFNISLPGEEGKYFNTGDIGYLENNYLYIVGRKKDMIIIRGRNFYPQDIEFTAEKSDENVIVDSCAAFGVVSEGEERLVVVAEIKKNLRFLKHDDLNKSEEKKLLRQKVIKNIYRSVVQFYQIEPYDIVLIQEKSIPKTSSGKIQRQRCRKQYMDKELKIWEKMSEGNTPI